MPHRNSLLEWTDTDEEPRKRTIPKEGRLFEQLVGTKVKALRRLSNKAGTVIKQGEIVTVAGTSCGRLRLEKRSGESITAVPRCDVLEIGERS